MGTIDHEVARHYASDRLEARILNGLAAMGCDLERLTVDDLAPVDEFHMGGRKATEALLADLDAAPRARVLDVGSGLGGTARLLAMRHGCSVTGVDLTSDYVAVARALTARVGLGEQVRFEEGSALALPFPDGAFDAVTMLHVGMNIEDKAALGRELARVLRVGGRLALYDVMRMGEGELAYPVPWAATPATSFLAWRDDYRRALAAAGLAIEAEADRTEIARQVFEGLRSRLASGQLPPVGLHLLMGASAPAKVASMMAGLERGIIAPIQMIGTRAARNQAG